MEFSLLLLDHEFLKVERVLIHLSGPKAQLGNWNSIHIRQGFVNVKLDRTQAHT